MTVGRQGERDGGRLPEVLLLLTTSGDHLLELLPATTLAAGDIPNKLLLVSSVFSPSM
jgi:hypothetical protein